MTTAPAGGQTNRKELFTTEGEAVRAEIEATAYLVAIHALIAGVAFRVLPLYTFALFPVLYSRCALTVHEVMHARGSKRVNPLLSILAFLQSPLTLGYAELRDIHLRHHSHLGTSADPESYLALSRARPALLRSLFSTEIDFLRYVRERGYRGDTAIDHFIRFALFVGFAWVNPVALLWYVGITRLYIGPSEFFFHHVLHSPETRSALPSPSPSLIRVGKILVGSDNLQALLFHDVHHRHMQVAAGRLHLVEPAPQADCSGRGRAAMRGQSGQK